MYIISLRTLVCIVVCAPGPHGSSFFFYDTATTENYTLSLHDALPISRRGPMRSTSSTSAHTRYSMCSSVCWRGDRKSTRLNSSHVEISYAVFCLKKKNSRQDSVG